MRILDSSSCEERDVPQILQCKHCPFTISKSEACEISCKQHLHDAHAYLSKLIRCGHCSTPYGSVAMLRNHTKSQHPNKSEKVEAVPWSESFDEVEESIHSSSQQTTEETRSSLSSYPNTPTESASSQSPNQQISGKKEHKRKAKTTLGLRKSKKRVCPKFDNSHFSDTDGGSDFEQDRARTSRKLASKSKAARKRPHQILSDSDSNNENDAPVPTTGTELSRKNVAKHTKKLRHNHLAENVDLGDDSELSADSDGDKDLHIKSQKQNQKEIEKGPKRNRENTTGNNEGSSKIRTTPASLGSTREEVCNRFVCTECGLRSKGRQSMRSHLSRHLKYKWMKCGHCCELFFTHNEVWAHSSRQHPDVPFRKTIHKCPTKEKEVDNMLWQAREQAKKEQVRKKLQQPEGASRLSSRPVRQKKIQPVHSSCHVQQGIQCVVCEEKFDSLNELKQHYAVLHPMGDSLNTMVHWRDVDTGAIFDICGVLQENGNNMKSVIQKYLCALCSFRSSQKETVLKHHCSQHREDWLWTVMLKTSHFAKHAGVSMAQNAPTSPTKSTLETSSDSLPTAAEDDGSGSDDSSNTGSLNGLSQPNVVLNDFVSQIKTKSSLRIFFEKNKIKSMELHGLQESKLTRIGQ